MKRSVTTLAKGKERRTIASMASDMSRVTSFTLCRSVSGKRAKTADISSAFVPSAIITKAPRLPCAALLVTTVYSSPFVRSTSSMDSLESTF